MNQINKQGDIDVISPFWNKKPKLIKNEKFAIRQDLIDQCVKLVSKSYPQMATLLKGFTDNQIRELLDTSRGWKKNSPALFWITYKKLKK